MSWFGKSKEEKELDESLETLQYKLQGLVAERDRYKEAYSNACDLKDKYFERVISEKDSINQSLAEENRDLARKLELYKALLSQIKIEIKLPERKK